MFGVSFLHFVVCFHWQEKQDDNVRVCVRCRPMNENEVSQGCSLCVKVWPEEKLHRLHYTLFCNTYLLMFEFPLNLHVHITVCTMYMYFVCFFFYHTSNLSMKMIPVKILGVSFSLYQQKFEFSHLSFGTIFVLISFLSFSIY